VFIEILVGLLSKSEFLPISKNKINIKEKGKRKNKRQQDSQRNPVAQTKVF